MRPVQSVNRQDQANELARSGDAGVGALCRYAQASGLIRHRTLCLTDGMCHHIILPSHLMHASHPIKGSTSRAFYSFTSPNSPAHSALARLVALLASVTREAKMVFSAPRPPSHTHQHFSSLCSGPVCGRAWVSRLSPHQATWPTVQFRPLTKPGSPGFRQSHGAD